MENASKIIIFTEILLFFFNTCSSDYCKLGLIFRVLEKLNLTVSVSLLFFFKSIFGGSYSAIQEVTIKYIFN